PYIIEGADLHGAEHACIVEGDLDVEIARRTMRIAAAHVLEAVFPQPHGKAEPPRQIADHDGVLDAALYAVAAAHVDVIVHAHGRAGQLERERYLIGNASQ